MSKTQEQHGRPDGWQSGKAMFAERKWVLLDTVVARASVHYSCIKHAETIREKARLLAQAKESLREALAIGNGTWPDRLSADQLDVLSTVALRGIRFFGFGLIPSLAPDPKLALSLSAEGLRRRDADTEPHTPALLYLNRAESFWLLGEWKKSQDEACFARVIYRRGIPDKPQCVRVMKRLGALDVLHGRTDEGRTDEGWELFEDARKLAREVAGGQVQGIEKLMQHLRRPWWHWSKLVVQFYQ